MTIHYYRKKCVKTRFAVTIALAWFFLLSLLAPARSSANWTSIGDYTGPYQLNANEITFPCTNATVKIEVCTEDILRIRMNPSGLFLPNEPWVVIKYDWPKSNFTVKDRGPYIDIATQCLTVKINKSPFRIDIYDEDTRQLCLEPDNGAMAFDGQKVICRKILTPTNHFFGLGQRYEKSDLCGQKYELWLTENVTPIPFFMATDGYGIFFHNTWKTTFDFTADPYAFSAPGGGELDYYFIYGPSFKHILNQYTKITGKSPLPPKWAFGLHASKWTLQKGQQGILSDVTAARNEKNWPLDSIRIHSKNCSQGIWAGPNLNWPDDGWGSFPAVDKLVKQLHDMHCHAIFWENPGIPRTCTDKYEQALTAGYFLMQDGQVWNGRFGYGMEPGALIDFCNPEARKWWAKLHNFMIDFDSDGAAGDHGEEVFGSMYSQYSKMKGDELHNLYSMLYDMASWQAYKLRNPNKRCVVWGRSLWAGTQRYPMQGTQDSHSEGKNIHGEIQGCINFGLSGVPFRIYTDNVTREILDSKRTDWPLSRLSQYLSLTVAGERTELFWTGNETADNNYRFYADLRYQLMPYIYTYAYQTTRTGLPLVRAMVLEYPNEPATYSAYAQYLLGEHLLIAPLWSDTTFERQIYLPKGKWFDFFDDTSYQGGQTITYHAPITKAPIIVKAGAIIPMAPPGQLYLDQKTDSLTLRIYPAAISSFTLYEDDGVTYDYQKGVFAKTRFTCTQTDSEINITKTLPQGRYILPERKHTFELHTVAEPADIFADENKLEKLAPSQKLENASIGWLYDKNKKILKINTNNITNKKSNIKIIKKN